MVPLAAAMRNRIRVLRAERRLTQRDLGRLAGVSREAILAIENEKHDPSLPLACRIAKALGVPLDQAFDLDDI
jgi:putative transcriptional regulator